MRSPVATSRIAFLVVIVPVPISTRTRLSPAKQAGGGLQGCPNRSEVTAIRVPWNVFGVPPNNMPSPVSAAAASSGSSQPKYSPSVSRAETPSTASRRITGVVIGGIVSLLHLLTELRRCCCFILAWRSRSFVVINGRSRAALKLFGPEWPAVAPQGSRGSARRRFRLVKASLLGHFKRLRPYKLSIII